ncbi:uncharacterized protein [Haliotis cracherodii]|uniref:uncharacterized protein n=1 Tax=Haliotis cracherodii TaxID=6455 RepID=UPI0039E99C21
MDASSRYKELILRAVIKCGLLRKILYTANHYYLLKFLPKGSVGCESRDIWRHVMKHAKDAGLLRDILEAAHRCGRFEEVVARAVDGGFLDFHEQAEVARPTADGVEECQLFLRVFPSINRKDIFRALTRPEVSIVQQKLVEQGKNDFVLRDVLEGAKQWEEEDLFCLFQHKWNLSKILTAAKEAGLLTNVLHAANQNGLLGKTVAGVKDASLLKDVLLAASEYGLLRKTVAAAKDVGLLTNVLPASSEHDLLEETIYFSLYFAAMQHNESFAHWLSILHEVNKIADFLRILIWLFLNFMTPRLCLRLCGTRDAEHHKSVISKVTSCSGDIERNPGPLFLNDWLKEMYSMLVRKWKGWQKKKIPWKQFGMPDPRNSGLDRETLIALFRRYGLLTHCAIQDDSDIYTEEFRLLRVYINDRVEPNIDQLDKIVRRRKLLVKFKELYGELSHLPESEREEVQRAVNNIHLQCVPFSGQGEVQEQREEEESDGANVEDEDEDRGAQIRDGPPQQDCPRGAVVANNEAAMPASSTIEDSVRQSNGPSGNNPDDFRNETLADDELIQVDSPPDHTPTDPASQSCSGPKVTNDSDETMKDTPDVTADPQILQPPGPVDVQSQSQKSQNFAIVPVEAPGQTPAPTPVLLQIPTTHVDSRLQNATLVQNLSRKRSHSLDSGSNCKSSKMVKLT